MTLELVPTSIPAPLSPVTEAGRPGGPGQMQAFQYGPDIAPSTCMDTPLRFIARDRLTCQLAPAAPAAGSFKAVLSLSKKPTCYGGWRNIQPFQEDV